MDSAQIEQELNELETRIERLRALYEQYFMGIERLEPTIPRKDVDRRIWVLRREQIRNTGLRFKFQMLIQRYNTFQQYWGRITREIETGTYRRDVVRAAKRVGAHEALTIVGRKRAEKFALLAEQQDELQQRRQHGRGAEDAPEELEELEADDLEEIFSEPPPPPEPLAPPPPEPLAPLPPNPATTKPGPGGKTLSPLMGLGLGLGARGPRAAQPAEAAGTRPSAAASPAPAQPSAPAPVRSRLAELAAEVRRQREAPAAGAVTPPAVQPPAAAPPAAATPPPVEPPPRQAAPRAPAASAATPAPAPPRERRPTPAQSEAAATDLNEQRLRQIYARYVDAKRAAQESTAGLTFERLAESLRTQTAKLREKNPSKNVDYEVITRDGKTMIKPILK